MKYQLNPKHKSLVLYYDQAPMFDALSDEEAGKLIKLVINMNKDAYPVINNPGVKVAFAQIQNRVFENDRSWSEKSDKSTLAINTRWLKENESKFKSGKITEAEYLSTKERLEAQIKLLDNKEDDTDEYGRIRPNTVM